ncbi:hypothetical protein HJFPF1_05885 [Paramyrothecium foliicola]|nr:hypothetical protein HJFPF1_05885 [Paramyrothecium foliicola]
MARDDFEYRCPVCGLPCRSCDLRLEGSSDSNLTHELDDAIGWLDDMRLLRDQDDEVGRRIPALLYTNFWEGFFTFIDYEDDDYDDVELPPSLGRDIDVFPAESKGIEDFVLIGPDGTRHHVDVNMSGLETFDKRVYLPLHTSCLELAERAMKTSPTMYINDLRGFFLALRWRHGISREPYRGQWFQPNYTLFLKDWYLEHLFGPSCYIRDTNEQLLQRWPGPSKTGGEFNMQYAYAYDPLRIPNLTDTLLSNLEESLCDSCVSKQDIFLRHGIETLPTEILDQIVAYLRPSRNFDPSRRGALPQTFWKEELLLGANGLLPWLWDLDVSKIREKAETPCPSGDKFEWNWELLVRQLTRGVFLDRSTTQASSWMSTAYQTNLRAFPPGLYNRRRIWQLLEEMFVGDSIPLSPWGGGIYQPDYTTEKAIQLYWTKSGKPRKEPIWIPCIASEGIFVRKPGGQVVITSKDKAIQYWQKATLRENPEHVEPAPVEEIYERLRKLGYPV